MGLDQRNDERLAIIACLLRSVNWGQVTPCPRIMDVFAIRLTDSSHRSPAFIVSAPRTGSSWLAGALARHPDLDVRGHVAHDNHNLYLSEPFRTLNPFADDSPGAGKVSGPFPGLSTRWLRRRDRKARAVPWRQLDA